MHVEHPQKNANTKVFTKTNITMNMNIDENAGPISGPFGCLCLRTENRSRKTRVFEYRDCGLGWGGVGWGGMLTFLVLLT